MQIFNIINLKWILLFLGLFLFGCLKEKSTEPPLSKAKSTIVKNDSIIKKECNYQDLSYNYDFKIKFNRISDAEYMFDSCIIKMYIINKRTQLPLDSIQVTSTYFYGDVFQNCDKVRSYITKKNEQLEVGDNDFGDFIIADLNFDSKEDIALIRDSGGNGGTFYNFYMQRKNGKFYMDRFLSDSVHYFPKKINKQNKTLTTYVHAGACCVGEHIYQLNKKRHWREISHKVMPVIYE